MAAPGEAAAPSGGSDGQRGTQRARAVGCCDRRRRHGRKDPAVRRSSGPGAGRAGLAREGTLAEHASEEALPRRARVQRARRQPEPRSGSVARRRRPIARGDPCRRAPHLTPRRAPRPGSHRPRAQAACRSGTALRPPAPPGGKARRTAGLAAGAVTDPSTPAGRAGRSRIANARLGSGRVALASSGRPLRRHAAQTGPVRSAFGRTDAWTGGAPACFHHRPAAPGSR